MRKIAALLTRISIRPKACTASTAIRAVSSSRETSTFRAMALPPAAAISLTTAFAVENVSDDNRSALRRKPATIGCANVPRSSRDDSDLATQPHMPPMRYWNNGMTEYWSTGGKGSLFHYSIVLHSVFQHSNLFIYSLSRCSLKSSGFHQGLMPRDSAMTRAALYPGAPVILPPG